jgi:hypothetical protein
MRSGSLRFLDGVCDLLGKMIFFLPRFSHFSPTGQENDPFAQKNGTLSWRLCEKLSEFHVLAETQLKVWF